MRLVQVSTHLQYLVLFFTVLQGNIAQASNSPSNLLAAICCSECCLQTYPPLIAVNVKGPRSRAWLPFDLLMRRALRRGILHRRVQLWCRCHRVWLLAIAPSVFGLPWARRGILVLQGLVL